VRILLSGDWHGNSQHVQNVFAHACRVDADLVFQVGDFGFGWRTRQGKGGIFLDEFSHTVGIFAQRAGIPCYWLPGNHDNYDLIEEKIVQPHHASKLIPNGYEHEPMVVYCPRPTALEFGGVKFLIQGGAISVDKMYRTPGKSWWHQEEITWAEIDECKRLSDKWGGFDVLLSHDFPWECNVVDRHLNPEWGQEAVEKTAESRKKISEIVKASGVKLVIHGHLHIAYTELIFPEPGKPVVVRGLDRDYTPMNANCYLLDTETFDSDVAEAVRLLKA